MGNKSRLRSLTKRSDFQKIKADGRIINVNSWFLAKARKTEQDELRLGWTIPRHVGTAVIRNRFRRWGREYFRRLTFDFKTGVDLNLIFKRREKDFFKSISHRDFDEALEMLAGKLRRQYE